MSTEKMPKKASFVSTTSRGEKTSHDVDDEDDVPTIAETALAREMQIKQQQTLSSIQQDDIPVSPTMLRKLKEACEQRLQEQQQGQSPSPQQQQQQQQVSDATSTGASTDSSDHDEHDPFAAGEAAFM